MELCVSEPPVLCIDAAAMSARANPVKILALMKMFFCKTGNVIEIIGKFSLIY